MHTRPTIFHLHHFRCSQTLCIMCIAHRFVKSFYGSWNYIRALSIEFAFQHFDPDLRKCHPNTVIATPQFMLQTVCVSERVSECVCVWSLMPFTHRLHELQQFMLHIALHRCIVIHSCAWAFWIFTHTCIDHSTKSQKIIPQSWSTK